VVVAAGEAGRPSLRLALGAGADVLAVEFVKAGASEFQFLRGGLGADLRVAMAGQNVPNEGGRQPLDQLVLFIGRG